MSDGVVKLQPTKPEAEVAAELKARVQAAMNPVLEIFDEAARAGLMIRWDSLQPSAPFFKHVINNLRIERHY